MLSVKHDHLAAVIASATKANRNGAKALEADLAKLSKDLAKLEKSSLALVDRLSAPSLKAITAISDRLSALEKEQQALKSRITELSLQIRDRRDSDISTEEVRAAYKDFAGLWKELDFDERQYALRLLVKEIRLKSRKKSQRATSKSTLGAGGQSHWPCPLPGYAKSCVTGMEGSPGRT